MYFMSMACGRPHEGDQVQVDACRQERGSKTRFSCGRHKWMTPYSTGSAEVAEDSSMAIPKEMPSQRPSGRHHDVNQFSVTSQQTLIHF